jgi:hypothetical protein
LGRLSLDMTGTPASADRGGLWTPERRALFRLVVRPAPAFGVALILVGLWMPGHAVLMVA